MRDRAHFLDVSAVRDRSVRRPQGKDPVQVADLKRQDKCRGVEITRPLLRGFGYAEPVRTVEPCEQHLCAALNPFNRKAIDHEQRFDRVA